MSRSNLSLREQLRYPATAVALKGSTQVEISDQMRFVRRSSPLSHGLVKCAGVVLMTAAGMGFFGEGRANAEEGPQPQTPPTQIERQEPSCTCEGGLPIILVDSSSGSSAPTQNVYLHSPASGFNANLVVDAREGDVFVVRIYPVPFRRAFTNGFLEVNIQYSFGPEGTSPSPQLFTATVHSSTLSALPIVSSDSDLNGREAVPTNRTIAESFEVRIPVPAGVGGRNVFALTVVSPVDSESVFMGCEVVPGQRLTVSADESPLGEPATEPLTSGTNPDAVCGNGTLETGDTFGNPEECESDDDCDSDGEGASPQVCSSCQCVDVTPTDDWPSFGAFGRSVSLADLTPAVRGDVSELMAIGFIPLYTSSNEQTSLALNLGVLLSTVGSSLDGEDGWHLGERVFPVRGVAGLSLSRGNHRLAAYALLGVDIASTDLSSSVDHRAQYTRVNFSVGGGMTYRIGEIFSFDMHGGDGVNLLRSDVHVQFPSNLTWVRDGNATPWLHASVDLTRVPRFTGSDVMQSVEFGDPTLQAMLLAGIPIYGRYVYPYAVGGLMLNASGDGLSDVDAWVVAGGSLLVNAGRLRMEVIGGVAIPVTQLIGDVGVSPVVMFRMITQ